jgi:hypothetical protein
MVVLETLVPQLATSPGLEAVALGGSRARGTHAVTQMRRLLDPPEFAELRRGRAAIRPLIAAERQ